MTFSYMSSNSNSPPFESLETIGSACMWIKTFTSEGKHGFTTIMSGSFIVKVRGWSEFGVFIARTVY